MDYKKAYIQLLDAKGDDKGEKIKVLFNPNEYSIEKSNQYQVTSLPGLSSQAIQYVSGNARTMTMDLFFDTYEKGEDVRNHTRKITELLEIDKELHAPPVCKFIWDELIFKAVIERITQKFTMFLDSGIPVRATLNITFREYKTLSEQIIDSPRESSDRTKLRVMQEGDNLWLIAGREYGDPGLWRHIAKANNIFNPRKLVPGKELIVPPLE